MNHLCPKCNTNLSYHTDCKFIVCKQCMGYFEVISNSLRLSKNFDKRISTQSFCFKLGEELTLNQLRYEVVAMVVRRDNFSNDWREYHLKNIVGEVSFLNEYNGNWTMIRLLSNPKIKYHNKNEIIYNQNSYSLFQKYNQQPINALGCFSFDIFENTAYLIEEFISPPYILIKEGKEWFFGEYVNEDEVYNEFLSLNNSLEFPIKLGVGAVELQQKKLEIGTSVQYSFFAIFFLIVAQFLLSKPERSVLKSEFHTANLIADSNSIFLKSKEPTITESFKIDRKTKLKVQLSSSVSNSWIEENITLVNEDTSEEFEFLISNEFYSGVEEGYRWTEGSTSESMEFSSLKPGKYHLIVESTAGYDFGYYTIELFEGGIYLSNFIIPLILFSIVPAYLVYNERQFEKSRWFNSDYSPFYQENEKDYSIWD